MNPHEFTVEYNTMEGEMQLECSCGGYKYTWPLSKLPYTRLVEASNRHLQDVMVQGRGGQMIVPEVEVQKVIVREGSLQLPMDF